MSTGFLIFPVGYAPTANGAVVPGGKLTFSRTGTSTAQDTYSDSTLSTPNANPVVLNAEGYLDTKVYGDPTTGFNYRIKFTDANDVEIWQVDDVTADVDDTRLSANIPLLNTANTFIAVQSIVTSGGSPRWSVSDGTVTAILFAGSGTGQVGSSSNHPLDLITNNSARLTISSSGDFDFKGGATSNFGVQMTTAAALGAAANAINTSGKFASKLVLDTTNHKLYTARGANATDPWDLADGSASVTPS